jgi:hypothetical protein
LAEYIHDERDMARVFILCLISFRSASIVLNGDIWIAMTLRITNTRTRSREAELIFEGSKVCRRDRLQI